MGLFFLPIVEGRATAAGPGPWNSAAIGPRLNVKAPVDPPPPPPLPLTKAGDMSLIQSICQFLPSRHNGYKKEKKHVCKKDAGYYSIWWWSCCCHTPFLSHPSYTIYHPLGHSFTWYSHIVSFFFFVCSLINTYREPNGTFREYDSWVVGKKKKHTKELQERCFYLPFSIFDFIKKGSLFSALSWETSCIIQPLSDVWIFLYQKLALMTFTLCRTNFAKVLFDGGQRSIEKASSVFTFVCWKSWKFFGMGSCRHFCQLLTRTIGRQRPSLSAGHSAENFIVTTVEFRQEKIVGTFLITWKYI